MATKKVIPTRIGSDLKSTVKFLDVIERRTLGFRNSRFGVDDSIAFKLYNSIYPFHIEQKRPIPTSIGGIFNLEFSLDG